MSEREALILAARAALALRNRRQHWRPLPGPQTMAYQSQADITLYGGAAGGGKTDLVLGLAHTQHWRTKIFRRVFPSLKAIIDRAEDILSSLGNYNISNHFWKLSDGRKIEFASLQFDKDVRDHQGQPEDFIAFDEITEFTESQFRFVIGWNRSTRPGQRCRVVATGNPPTNAAGRWVLKFWAPWLDKTYPNPGKPGELRWFTTLDGKDHEVPNGAPVLVDGKKVYPRSRTFIPAKVEDNPYLVASGYVGVLQSLPEPLRSQMLLGDFTAGLQDDAFQVIPTAWVEAAQRRWEQIPKPDEPMSALGMDVARGGKCKTALAPRYGTWFDEVITFPGKDTPDGDLAAAQALLVVTDRAPVQVDAIGVGTSAYDSLKRKIGDRAVPLISSNKVKGTDKSGVLAFVNLRAKMWWGLREDLDPASGLNLCLPPGQELLGDLCAPRWTVRVNGIQIEAKEDLSERIGRSPDIGEAVVYAHYTGGDAWLALINEDLEGSHDPQPS